MPSRLEPFVNNGIFHIFNKTIDNRRVFDNSRFCSQFFGILEYYRSGEIKFSYSKLTLLDLTIAKTYLRKISRKVSFRINILAFCLMPNHFHLLLKQSKDEGISHFMADVINSFTRYSNIKLERKGPLFLPDFKSVKVNNEAQFMHVSRYIHLNPYSSGLIKSYSDLKTYTWSSFKDYINITKNNLVSQREILSLFNGNRKKYERFVISNAEHQRTLELIKYAEKW